MRAHLEVIRNDSSAAKGRCSKGDAFFSMGGPGLQREGTGIKALERAFDKHFREMHSLRRVITRCILIAFNRMKLKADG